MLGLVAQKILVSAPGPFGLIGWVFAPIGVEKISTELNNKSSTFSKLHLKTLPVYNEVEAYL